MVSRGRQGRGSGIISMQDLQKRYSLTYPMSLWMCHRSKLEVNPHESIRMHEYLLTDLFPRSTSATKCSRNDRGHAVMNVFHNMHNLCIADDQINARVRKHFSALGWLMHPGKSSTLFDIGGPKYAEHFIGNA